MNKFIKISLSIIILVTSFSLTACRGEKSDVSLENVFPKEPSMVMVVDYSDLDQVENFRSIMSRFPETGLGKKIAKAFWAGGLSDMEPFSWEEDFKPIFEGEWKIGMSMTFPEDLKSINDFDKLEPENAEVFLAGEFSESDKVRALIEKAREQDVSEFGKVKYEEIDGVEYWSDPETDQGFLVAYGDVFFMTWAKKDADAAVKRIKEGGGFSENERFALTKNSLGKKNLGYVFYSKSIFQFYDDAMSAMGLNFSDFFSGFGDLVVLLSAESGGFRLGSSMAVEKDSKIASLIIPNRDYKLSLIEKINGDGVFYYSESGGMAKGSLNYFLNLYQQILKNPGLLSEGAVKSGDGLSLDPASLQASALISPGDVAGVEQAISPETVAAQSLSGLADELVQRVIDFFYDIEVLLESPGAFVMSDIGTYFPTASIYFQIDEKNLAEVKGLVVKLDGYVDRLIGEVDKAVGVSGLIKKDVEVMDGAALNKLYLDMSALSGQNDLNLEMFVAIAGKSLKLEAYYGLTSDNVFVIAIYPDFPKAYGKNVLADNKDFKDAVKSLGDDYGFGISYFRTKPVLDFIERILNPVAAFGGVDGKDKERFELYGRRFVGAIEYIITSNVVKDNGLIGSSFIRIKKVEEEKST